VTHDVRDEVVDYVAKWSGRTELPATRVVKWIGLGMSKFYDWRKRYGMANEHNALVPRDHWLEAWEREAIVAFHYDHPLEGYRRLTYMMMDADVVAASAATVYRVLAAAGCFARWNRKESSKGRGFQQPLRPHEHWHVDISYVNVCGTFYYLTSVLDGASRFIVHWELRESMREADIEIVLQRAREKFTDARPRVITDNGPQFIARDFHEFIRLAGMTHVRTSPYYPQSNGKIERWHQTLKVDCLRPTSRCHSRKHDASSKASWSITTTSAYTARLATSRRPTSSPAVKRRSSPSETASSKRPVNEGAVRGNLRLPTPMHYNTG
jgi:putative transposase